MLDNERKVVSEIQRMECSTAGFRLVNEQVQQQDDWLSKKDMIRECEE